MALGGQAVAAHYGLMAVKDCPVTGAKLPLVVSSHGRGGWFAGHHDTAEALADAGFVVAAISSRMPESAVVQGQRTVREADHMNVSQDVDSLTRSRA